MWIEPLSGLANPVIRFRRVDLPLPVGPINTIIVLSCNFRLIGPSVNPGNDLVTLIISRVNLISFSLLSKTKDFIVFSGISIRFFHNYGIYNY